jgi:hypothetical protein
MDMNDAFTIADKVMDPEKAIALTANLQVLGGAIGDFNDPLKLMYDATNNVEGLQDALIKASGSLATYNSVQGRFEVTGINLRKSKEMADALGISMGELNKISIAAAERTQATTALMSTGLVMKDEDREFLTNLSRMDGGEMKIMVPKSLMESLGIKEQSLALKDLLPAQQKILLDKKVAFEQMNPKNMAMAQLTETQQISRGVDVIVALAKIRVAAMSKGAAQGAFGKEIAEFKKAVNAFDVNSLNIPTKKEAEKFGAEIRTDPIAALKTVVNRNTKEPPVTPPPPAPRETNVNFKFGPIPGYLDALGRDMLKNPNSLMLNIPGISNEYTTPKVAAGK